MRSSHMMQNAGKGGCACARKATTRVVAPADGVTIPHHCTGCAMWVSQPDSWARVRNAAGRNASQQKGERLTRKAVQAAAQRALPGC